MELQSCSRRWARRSRLILPLVGVALGCSADPPAKGEPLTVAVAPIAARPGAAPRTAELTWGSGPEQVGLRPAATELPAEGPSAVAVGPSGEVVILDRLNDRILM